MKKSFKNTSIQVLAALAICALSGVFSPVFAADEPATREALSRSREWLKLLHYEQRPFGGVRSRMPQGNFFFAPDGRTNPRAELDATVAAFARSDLRLGKLKLHAQCAFPLRFQFLKEKLSLKVQSQDCPKLREFTDLFQAKSVSLMFSTAYPNNPGSMFGHTFFKFNSGVRSELLDQSLSYAAFIAGEAGLLYMARGIFGGYYGAFARTPYYVKVNEYNNSESRDLWEYELNLTEDQVNRLLLHFWELEVNSSFKYFFFDENCAFILLAALEAVRSDWEFNLSRWYFVIPGETVSAVARIPGAIRRVEFRPSIRKRFFQAEAALTSEERQELRGVARHQKEPGEVKNAAVLDVAALYFQYVKERDAEEVDGSIIDTQKRVLQTRSAMSDAVGISSRTLPRVDQGNDPRLAHGAKRLTLGYGDGSAGSFEEMSFRFAYHDLMDRDPGYERFSHFDFPYLTVRRQHSSGKFSIEELNIAKVTSLFPWTVLERRFSWSFALDYRALKDLACERCHAAHLDASAGSVLNLGSFALVGLMGGLQLEAGSAFSTGWRVVPKAQ
ncbi:MAG: DUF4105 domain-containing protein, partial [Bdellovibrionales bacterium]|nr:DUF4105 domain-containing protein [Bdellovibrionales bacterium]